MAFGTGVNNLAQQRAGDWVDQTMTQMRGGGVGSSLARGLGATDPGAAQQRAKAWVDQTMGQMGAGRTVDPAQYGVDVSGEGAANWVSQTLGGGGTGALGGLSPRTPNLDALTSGLGGSGLGGQDDSTRRLMQMMGSAGMGPGTLGANPLGGLV